jgi:TorA maturation chaperone TorD
MSTAAPLNFVPTLPPEEEARANFYGLLARLFYAPPDALLLEALAGADDMEADDDGFALAWRDLSRAAGAANLDAVREEYDAAFVGTGKSPVTLYTCAYTLRYSNEAPLAELRGMLRALGLARRERVSEPEDHMAALCDTMRHLVAGQQKSLEDQARFFSKWIWPAAQPLCAAVEASEVTAFYKSVARFAKCFLQLEHDAFEML